MSACKICAWKIEPAKDFFITVHERKGASFDFCSLACAAIYLDDL